MEKLIANIIKRRIIVLVLVVVAFAAGLMSFAEIPKQQYPIIQIPVVIITTTYPGASAADMEELVTEKIEDVCMATEGFDNVKSDSYNSVSVVKMMFNRGLSEEKLQDCIDALRNDINDLKENELPSGVTSVVFNDDALETCGYITAFTSDTETNEQLVQRAESLKSRLISMKGVTKVEVEGEIQRQIKVTVDQDKLNHINVSLAELSQIINYQNSTIPAGTIKYDQNKIYIDSSGKLEGIDELSEIIISIDNSTGAITRLKDVAKVEWTDDENSKHFSYNGKSAVILGLYFDENSNMIKVGKDVSRVVEEYKSTIDSNVEMNTVVYLPDDVKVSINDFLINLAESVIIVLFVVMMGMSVVNGSIVAIVIPLAIFITFIVMKLFLIDVQFVSLASLIIALGMLVDNAIVISDEIQVRYDAGESKLTACAKGVKNVVLPVMASTLTTVVIFCVFYNLPGTMKRFVFSLPTIVIAALSASFFISLFVTPVLCFMFIKKSKARKEKTKLVRQLFTRLLHLGLKYKAVTIIISLVCVAVSIAVMLSMDLELLPNSDKMLLDVDIETDNLYDIRLTDDAVQKTGEILSKEPQVEYYLSAAGGRVPKYDFSSMPGMDATHIANFVVKINVDKNTEYSNKEEYCTYLNNKIGQELSGCKVTIKEIGIIPKPDEQIQIKFCGNDYNKLNEISDKAEAQLKSYRGVRNIYNDKKIKTYNYYIDTRNDSLNSNGLTKAEVQNEMNIAMMGRDVTVFRKEGKEYPVKLVSNIKDEQGLKNMKVKSSVTGGKYSISQIADVSVKNDYNTISRYNGIRCTTLTAIPKGGKSAVMVQKRLKEYLDSLSDEERAGVNIEYEGDMDMLEEIISNLLIGALIGTFVIFLILYLQFYSIRKNIIIFMTIPFALIGSTFGLKLCGQNLSMFAILGIISLIGVVVNNAIVLVDYMDDELSHGVSVDEACKTAVDKRFRPIILSTSTSVMGLIPLILSGDVLFTGMSIAFMFGLSTSLFFTLIVIPVLYSIFMRNEGAKLQKSAEND